MKYVVYTILAIIAFLLFMPTTDGKEIRNLPLLIALLVIIAGFLLWQLLRWAVFCGKSEKDIEKEWL